MLFEEARYTSLLSLAALFILGCSSGPSPEGGAAAGPAPAVVVTDIIQKSVPLYTEYVARTEANASVEIRARVEGVLEEVHFEDGARLKRGQPLFTIERRPYEAVVQDARASLSRAEADLYLAQQQVELVRAKAQLAQANASLTKTAQDVARLRPLAAEAAVPEQELDAAVAAEQVARAEVDAAAATVQNTELTTETYVLQAEAAIEKAQAAVTQAELNLDYTNIRSPIDGQVGRRLVDPGNLVGRSESTLLATVASSNPIKAIFGVSETDYLAMAKRHRNSEGQVALDDPDIFELILADDSVFENRGRFVAAENTIDPQTGTLTIETLFSNPSLILRPGQFARIRFPVAMREDALLAPKRAILRIQGVDSVYKVSAENRVALHTVAIGGEFEDFVILSSGVQLNDRIVVEGHQKVRPGMQVTPSPRSVASDQAGN